MQAAVVISAQPLVGANDDHRVTSNVINIVIAYLANVLLPACELPDTPPHFLHFQFKKLAVRVTTEWNVGGRLTRIVVFTEDWGHVVSVAQCYLLIALPRSRIV